MNEESMIEAKIIQNSIDLAKEFLSKIISPPAEELGLLLQDQVRFWRFKNQIKILEKAKNFATSRKTKIKYIPVKILVPLLDGCSLEDDPKLQDSWANLVVSYCDSDKRIRSSVFPYILSQISPVESKCIEFLYLSKVSLHFDKFWEEYKVTDAELSNLVRLGVFRTIPIIKSEEGQITSHDYGTDWEQKIWIEELPDYELTELGSEFYEACNE